MASLENKIDETTAIALADLFRTLGDSTRIIILAALSNKEFTVGELAKVADISESATSHHLRHLRQMRIVKHRKEGRFVIYSLDDEHIEQLIRFGFEHVGHE